MRWLEKIRRIFASDKTYSKRDKAGLARNSLWDGVYDRSKTPKDGAHPVNRTVKYYKIFSGSSFQATASDCR